MPTDQALSLCPQTKLNDELNHDKDSYSVPTGFWDQSYWGERSDESIKIIQKVNGELNHDKDTYAVPTGFWDQGYWGERSAESTKIIQISAVSIKSIRVAEDSGTALPAGADKDQVLTTEDDHMLDHDFGCDKVASVGPLLGQGPWLGPAPG